MTGQEKKIKISELPASVTFTGLWTLGYQIVDGKKTSVRVSLEEIQTAYNNVVSATTAATEAASSANNAARNAAAATETAVQAAALATQQAEAASEAAETATNAATEVGAAISAANEAANAANAAAGSVNTAIGNAETATKNAGDAAKAANDAAEGANTAKEAANAAAEAANTAATLANEKAGLADTAASAANQAKQDADTATGLANQATEAANSAASAANQAKTAADTATAAAQEATAAANQAATTANEKAALADTAAQNANTATEAANTATTNATAATELMQQLNAHPMKPEGGYWFQWDVEQQAYVNTGIQAKGDVGASFKIIGRYDTLEELKEAVPDGTDVDGVYAVGAEEPFNYYAWVVVDGTYQWDNQGQLQGAEGKSAFEVWKSQPGNADKTEQDYFNYISPQVDPETGHWEVQGTDTGVRAKAFDAVVEEDPSNTPDSYKLQITTAGGTITTPNLKGASGTAVRDIDHVPGEDDTHFTENEVEYAWSIGDEVRYFDPDLSEYLFYKLHDITSDGAAVWQESGSGGKFKGEEVAITVTSDQGDPDVALFGMLFTVKIGVKESYYPYNGAPIIVEVERGKECTITPPEREGYLTPEAQSFTADIGERTVTFAYKGVCVITFNQLLDTPENITVTSGSILTKLEQAARKRYLVKQTTNGTVAAPLLASNTAFFEDSAAAPILGTDGDVMNPLPEFYYKIERDEAAKEVLLYIAENDPDGTYKHIPASWVGTYKASLLDGKLRSISGAEPCRGEVWNDLKAAATQRGEGFELVGYDQHCVIALLLYGLYQTRDIRYQLGTGGATYDANLTTGSTNQTGNADTRATNTIAGYISGLGIEGVYGGLYEYMDRIYKLKDEWHITEADGTERIVTTPAGLQGWTKRMLFEISDTFDLIPSETGASSSTGYTTFFEAAYSEWLPIRAARSGFTAGDDNPDVGVSYLNALDMGNTSSPFYGTRLAYRGEVTIVTPSEYREMEN